MFSYPIFVILLQNTEDLVKLMDMATLKIVQRIISYLTMHLSQLVGDTIVQFSVAVNESPQGTYSVLLSILTLRVVSLFSTSVISFSCFDCDTKGTPEIFMIALRSLVLSYDHVGLRDTSRLPSLLKNASYPKVA